MFLSATAQELPANFVQSVKSLWWRWNGRAGFFKVGN